MSGGEHRSLRRVVHVDSLPTRCNSEAFENPQDRGRFKELISKELSDSDDIYLGMGWLEPGETHLLHHHRSESEFYYVLAGCGKVTLGDEMFDVQPGTAVYIPAGEKHMITNDGKETMVVLFGYNSGSYVTVWDD